MHIPLAYNICWIDLDLHAQTFHANFLISNAYKSTHAFSNICKKKASTATKHLIEPTIKQIQLKLTIK